MKKTIALFGGTGSMGQHFLRLALEEGHAVKALTRNPERFNFRHPRLTVIKGDVLVREDVLELIRDTEIVVSLFGHSFGKKEGPAAPDHLQTEGTRHIVHAMKTHGVERIISLSGGGLPFPEKDRPKLFPDKAIRLVMNTFFGKLIEDAKTHAKVLRDSGLKWTIVRGARFTDDYRNHDYRVGWVGVNSGAKIGRKDLAHFVLTQVEDQRFNYQMPMVSY